MKTKLILVLLAIVLRTTTSHKDVTNLYSQSEKVSALQETLKTLLKLPEIDTQGKGNSVDPPKHLVHLLEHLSEAREWSARKNTWNTIRTLQPRTGLYCERDSVFVFDMSSLPPEETIISIQLHFFKFKMDTSEDDHERLKLDILKLKDDKNCQVIRSLNVPLPSYGWQVADVTNDINTTMGLLSGNFGARFKVERVPSFSTHRPGKSTLYDFERKVAMHASPFVMIFTKDPNLKEEKVDHVQRNFETEIDSSGLEPEDSVIGGNGTLNHRWKRGAKTFSLMTNEYPEVVDEETYYTATDTFPKFTERNRKRQSKKRTRTRTRKMKSKRKHTKTLLEKQRKKSRKKEDDEIEQYPFSLCSRRVMRVDFGMIGWNAYVISPKSFDAYYCAGECPFPMTKDLNPSNHAAVQSIVHALEAVKGVPPPCCVPDKLSPLSILYFDENRNVVLKVYPNMSVDTCACR
ncbi:growth/differentiation factor 10-like [Glandiceps talaboti]